MEEFISSNEKFKKYYNDYVKTTGKTYNKREYNQNKSPKDHLEFKNKENNIFLSPGPNLIEEQKRSKIMSKIEKFNSILHKEDSISYERHKQESKHLTGKNRKSNTPIKLTVQDLVVNYEAEVKIRNCDVELHPIQISKGVLPLIEKFDKDEDLFRGKMSESRFNPRKKLVVPQNVLNCLNNILEEKLMILKKQNK